MNHRVSQALVALVLLIAAAPSSAEPQEKVKPRIEDLSAQVDQDRAMVSYRLTGIFTSEIEERIQSGIPVSIKHRIEVKVKRGFPLLVDKFIARAVVDTSGVNTTP